MRVGSGSQLASAWDPAPPSVAPAVPTFSQLYEQYFDFVWRVLRSSGVHPALVEDAAQDVFVVVHRRLPEYRPDASPKTWLFAIATRVAKDYRRKAARKGGLLPLEEAEATAATDDPFDAAACAQAWRVVEAYLDALDEDRRNVFMLSELAQMTAPEIASALSMNLNTVYSRLRSARRGFAMAVEQVHINEGTTDD